jgi:hypothetical protein
MPLTPYDRVRIAMEQVGAVLGAMRMRDSCPAEEAALSLALEELDELAAELAQC